MTSPDASAAPGPLAALDLRVGTVVEARLNARARVPALVLRLDFGPLGHRTSSAQLTARYDAGALVGRQVVAVLGLPPKRVAGVVSECLVLAAVPEQADRPGEAVLLGVDAPVPNGTRVA